MGILETVKNLPRAGFQAMRDYFAGLQVFFNRQNWSHSVVFFATLIFFAAFHFFQPLLKILFREPGYALAPVITNVVFTAYFAGCASFIGFLLLALIALLPPGRNLLYESRIRHLISPLVIGGLILIFTITLPHSLGNSRILWGIFGQDGVIEFILRSCWSIMVLLQVILLGYTVVKIFKWLGSYLRIPEANGSSPKYRVTAILLIILIPLAILFWYPIIRWLMVGNEAPIVITGPIAQHLPQFVRWLLEHQIWDYPVYLWIICPIALLSITFLMLRRHPRIAVALGTFSVIYPALVYYYRFRVDQYFLNWSRILAALAPRPYPGAGLLELGLILLTFFLVLQGTAKYQRKVSPNPFALFALMIGTLTFALLWILNPSLTLWLGVEWFNMVTAALSAFFAVFVFAFLPLFYGLYRHRQLSKHPPISIESSKDNTAFIEGLELD